MTTYLRCRLCEQNRPVEQFPTARANGRLYRRRWCRACLRDYYAVRAVRKWREKRLQEAGVSDG